MPKFLRRLTSLYVLVAVDAKGRHKTEVHFFSREAWRRYRKLQERYPPSRVSISSRALLFGRGATGILTAY